MLPDALASFLDAQGVALARTAAMGAACVALQAFRPAVAQPQVRPGMRTDVAHAVLGPVLNRLVATPVTVALALTVPTPPRTVVTALPFVVTLLLALGLADFLGYWRHRWQHGAALWRFHAVHHSSRWLDWLSTSRFHPVDEGLTLAVHVVPLWLCGVPTEVLAATMLLRGLHGTLVHANVDLTLGPLDRWIVTPRFHRWHHSEARPGVNFATHFVVWDRLFGTACFADEEPESTGLPGDPIPDDYAAQILRPFARPTPTEA
jgi:sterol desaturase/sphingolipid hydroxylase (fatty acid hydroxylase superfamily)